MTIAESQRRPAHRSLLHPSNRLRVLAGRLFRAATVRARAPAHDADHRKDNDGRAFCASPKPARVLARHALFDRKPDHRTHALLPLRAIARRVEDKLSMNFIGLAVRL